MSYGTVTSRTGRRVGAGAGTVTAGRGGSTTDGSVRGRVGAAGSPANDNHKGTAASATTAAAPAATSPGGRRRRGRVMASAMASTASASSLDEAAASGRAAARSPGGSACANRVERHPLVRESLCRPTMQRDEFHLGGEARRARGPGLGVHAIAEPRRFAAVVAPGSQLQRLAQRVLDHEDRLVGFELAPLRRDPAARGRAGRAAGRLQSCGVRPDAGRRNRAGPRGCS